MTALLIIWALLLPGSRAEEKPQEEEKLLVEATPAPRVQVGLANEKGKLVLVVRDISSAWVRRGDQVALETRFKTRVPKGFKLVGSNGTLGRILSVRRQEKGSADALWVVEQTGRHATIDASFKTAQGERRIALALRVEKAVPTVVAYEKCDSHRLSLQALGAAGEHLYVAIGCREEDDGIAVEIRTSEDSSWSVPDTVGAMDDAHRVSIRFSRPAVTVGQKRVIRVLGVLDQQKKKARYALNYSPRAREPRWRANFGVALTYLAYDETAVDVSLKELMLTLKATGIYHLIPRLLTADVTVFGNIAALASSPQHLPTAQVLGFNGRLGYRLPVDLGGTEWFFLGGWYFWAMETVADLYGVYPLSGPQVFIQVSHMPARGISWSAYAKLAVVSDALRLFQLENNELSVGGSIGIFRSPRAPRATLDLSRIRFQKGPNEMSMWGVSAGMSYAFW
ncbi:MAG: hypothetical protein IT285_14890 [Bdellovibrionales bacterium]|nr:hypothetical protein [Bdellovibrionales bacterium]